MSVKRAAQDSGIAPIASMCFDGINGLRRAVLRPQEREKVATGRMRVVRGKLFPAPPGVKCPTAAGSKN